MLFFSINLFVVHTTPFGLLNAIKIIFFFFGFINLLSIVILSPSLILVPKIAISLLTFILPESTSLSASLLEQIPI